MKTVSLLVAAALAISGCVTQKSFRQVESSLGECRQDLQVCGELRTDCERNERALGSRLSRAEASANELAHLLEVCRARTAQVREDARGLDRRAEALRQSLQAEIAAKDVEIEQLRDRLSLRMLDRILFRSGSAEILPEGRVVLDKVAAVLAAGDELVRVEGHTDTVPIGTRLQEKYPTNWELSTARASSVVRYFADHHGVAPTRMEAVGFSMYRPVAEGDAAEDLQRNRRVEVVLSAPGH